MIFTKFDGTLSAEETVSFRR